MQVKHLFLYCAALAFSTQLTAQSTSQIDPNHLATGGYGKLISEKPEATIWWAEGAYKVMQDAPIPSKKEGRIELSSAKNEWESFILVFNPKQDIQNLKISLSTLESKEGTIDASAVTVRKVEYVNVTHPTDSYTFKGLWPDPLPLYKEGGNLKAGINQPYWISIKTPKEAKTGVYTATVTITGDGFKEEVPIKLNVWNFALPDSPTMRSGFGLNLENVKKYNNLHTPQDIQKGFDSYMAAFRDYKVSPYNPFELTPIVETVTGVDWQGGFFDSENKRTGKYGYMVVDKSLTANVEASLRTPLAVSNEEAHNLQWWAKSDQSNQPFVVGVECLDANGNLIWFENRYEEYAADSTWKSYTLPLGKFTDEIKSITIKLYPSKRTATGENVGTVWFDDMVLTTTEKSEGPRAWVQEDDGIASSTTEEITTVSTNNLLAGGDFEVNIDEMDIQLDFTAYNQAAKKYFEEYGFNSYSLKLKGLGGGTYYSRSGGVFEGFAQGTEEYNVLMSRYLKQIQDNLEQSGLLGKEYIYWFDEPGDADYPFVHETNAMIKRYAPKLTTFLTEHLAGHDISDVTDISCTIWHKLNHNKIKTMNERGLEHWSYLCCWPKSPWISEFIDHDAINFRMWMWASYKYGLKGVLIWETTYWNSPEASPLGKLQNPWTEAMSWVTGYGWIQGKQTIWGNGDGRMFYPENRDVNNDKQTYANEAVPSIRLEIQRDGIEDYDYLVLLEKLIKDAPKSKAAQVKRAKKLLEIPESIYTNEQTYNKDPQAILAYRKRLAEAILSLQ